MKKNVKVLGSGCQKCRTTLNDISSVAEELGIEIELEKVEDFAEIARFAVMATPSVVVDGAVVHTGGVPTRKTIESWIR